FRHQTLLLLLQVPLSTRATTGHCVLILTTAEIIHLFARASIFAVTGKPASMLTHLVGAQAYPELPLRSRRAASSTDRSGTDVLVYGKVVATQTMEPVRSSGLKVVEEYLASVRDIQICRRPTSYSFDKG